MPRFSDYPSVGVPDGEDLLPITDVSQGTTEYVTVTNLAEAIDIEAGGTGTVVDGGRSDSTYGATNAIDGGDST